MAACKSSVFARKFGALIAALDRKNM